MTPIPNRSKAFRKPESGLHVAVSTENFACALGSLRRHDLETCQISGYPASSRWRISSEHGYRHGDLAITPILIQDCLRIRSRFLILMLVTSHSQLQDQLNHVFRVDKIPRREARAIFRASYRNSPSLKN